MFVYVLLCIIHSCFAIILKRKRKLVALLLLSHRCIATINVLWLFLMVPWVGLQCVIVVFPDYTHLLFYGSCVLDSINVAMYAFQITLRFLYYRKVTNKHDIIEMKRKLIQI